MGAFWSIFPQRTTSWEPRIAHLAAMSLVPEKSNTIDCHAWMISTRLSTWCFLEWIYATGKCNNPLFFQKRGNKSVITIWPERWSRPIIHLIFRRFDGRIMMDGDGRWVQLRMCPQCWFNLQDWTKTLSNDSGCKPESAKKHKFSSFWVIIRVI